MNVVFFNVLMSACLTLDKNIELESDAFVGIKPKKKLIKPPSMYQVILVNDDYTPMDFVVEVLSLFFYMSEKKAVATMLEIHSQGQAVCGIYSKDVAETKVLQITECAKKYEHPLLSKVVKIN